MKLLQACVQKLNNHDKAVPDNIRFLSKYKTFLIGNQSSIWHNILPTKITAAQNDYSNFYESVDKYISMLLRTQ